MKTKREEKRFNTREQLLAALRHELERLSASGEYEIFLHEMTNDIHYGGDSRRIEATERIANRILVQGLDLGLYGSICGTARGYGDSSRVRPEEICDYFYPGCNNSAMRAVAIIAIPKFIDVDGKKLEYACCSRLVETDRLIDKAGLHPRADHYCIGLFDCIKGRWPVRNANGEIVTGAISSHLPLEYLVGVEEIVEEDGDYRLILPHTHISEICEQERQRHLLDAATLIKKTSKKYGTTNVPELIFKKIEDDYQRWQERETEYD